MVLASAGKKGLPGIEAVLFGGVMVAFLLLMMIVLRVYSGRDSRRTSSSRCCDTVRCDDCDVAVVLTSARMRVERRW